MTEHLFYGQYNIYCAIIPTLLFGGYITYSLLFTPTLNGEDIGSVTSLKGKGEATQYETMDKGVQTQIKEYSEIGTSTHENIAVQTRTSIDTNDTFISINRVEDVINKLRSEKMDIVERWLTDSPENTATLHIPSNIDSISPLEMTSSPFSPLPLHIPAPTFPLGLCYAPIEQTEGEIINNLPVAEAVEIVGDIMANEVYLEAFRYGLELLL